jgi:hypothetical protein
MDFGPKREKERKGKQKERLFGVLYGEKIEVS